MELTVAELNAAVEAAIGLAHEDALGMVGAGFRDTVQVSFGAVLEHLRVILDLTPEDWSVFQRANRHTVQQRINTFVGAVVQGIESTVGQAAEDSIHLEGELLAEHLVDPVLPDKTFRVQAPGTSASLVDVVNGRVFITDKEGASLKNIAAVNVAMCMVERGGHGFQFRKSRSVKPSPGTIRKAVTELKGFSKKRYMADLLLNMQVHDAVVLALRAGSNE